MRRFGTFLILATVAAGCGYSMIEKGILRSSDLRRTLAATAATRGLPAPPTLRTEVLSRSDVPALLRRLFMEQWSEAERRDAQAMLTAIGLWPPGLDLMAETIRVQASTLAGLYSPRRRTLFVVEGAHAAPFLVDANSVDRDLYVEFVVAHEVVHALQHNAFPELFTITGQIDEDDVAQAVHAALEGDAMRYGLEAIMEGRSELPWPLGLALQTDAGVIPQEPRDAPAVLRYLQRFPYARGYRLAQREGKHLLADPPASTEQAIHPDKRHEPFLSLDLGEVPLPSECRKIGENTVGEALLSVLLRDLDASVAAAAWEGWGGDRYLVADCAGRRDFVWITAWDSEGDAGEFRAAYDGVAALLAERTGLDAAPRTEKAGVEVLVHTGPFRSIAASMAAHVRRRRVATLSDVFAAKETGNVEGHGTFYWISSRSPGTLAVDDGAAQ